MNKIVKIILFDILRNKVLLFYTLFLAGISWSVFSLEDNSDKGILSLLNILLLALPLVSVVFATIYLYNSSEFIELLLSQPIHRKKIWRSLFWGLSMSLCLAFVVGVGLPLLFFAPFSVACIILLSGVLLTMEFVAVAFLSSVFTRDKAKGIGVAILLWLFFALLFDGLVLFLMFQFADYPIEKAMLVVAAFNPVDLARIVILLHLNVSAMLGYTGAIFREVFGTNPGLIIVFSIMTLWVFLPFTISARRFNKKDL